MNQAIDRVSAFLDRGLDGLRDAIKQERQQDMSEQKQYDNSNQLGLWKVDEDGRTGYYRGYGDVGGEKVFEALLVVGPKTGKSFASLHWRTGDGWQPGVDIWNNDGKLGGKTDDLWINVFKNEVEPGSKRPVLSVKFKAKEPVGAAASASVAETVPDDLPF